MADVLFAPQDAYAGQSASERVQRLFSLAGAGLSVALVAGVCLWGYRLAVRDVTGVPVVRAMEGPMRIAPDTPGGDVTAYQGLAVNQVAADGVAGGPSDRLVLAPRPVDLTAEDQSGAFGAPAAPTSARAATDAGLVIAAVASPADTASAIEAALSEVVEEGEITDAVDVSGTLGEAPGAEAPVMLAAAVAGPSLRPMPRPARLAAAAATVAPAEPAPPAAVIPASLPEIDPATLAAGTRLVQLGAFDTVEAARAEWDLLAGRFGELMRDKARVVEPAQSAGRTFFRLRAHGFADETAARRFCSALLAEQAACIPVAQR